MRVDPSEFLVTESSYSTKLYTLIGQETYIDDDGCPRVEIENNMVFAKVVQNKPSKTFNNGHQYRFYIKTNPNKIIHNPVETYSLKEKDSHAFLNKVCKAETVFTEVTQSIFNQYINFLKTKSIRWLDSAQRELK